MAISNRVLAYAGSTKNIAGCALALVGVVLMLFGVAGPYWPVVVAGLYGVGALLAPPDRVKLTISHAEVESRQLFADLDTLLAKIDGNRFPDDVTSRVLALAEVLRDILRRTDVLTTSPDQLHIVSQTIRDYLPSSLEAYANLPRSYALTRRGERQHSAHEELLAQLDLLDTELRKVAESVYRGDEQALRDQGRFLQDRFGPSNLDL